MLTLQIWGAKAGDIPLVPSFSHQTLAYLYQPLQ